MVKTSLLGGVIVIPKKYFQGKSVNDQFFGNAGKYFWPIFQKNEKSQSGEFWWVYCDSWVIMWLMMEGVPDRPLMGLDKFFVISYGCNNWIHFCALRTIWFPNHMIGLLKETGLFDHFYFWSGHHSFNFKRINLEKNIQIWERGSSGIGGEGWDCPVCRPSISFLGWVSISYSQNSCSRATGAKFSLRSGWTTFFLLLKAQWIRLYAGWECIFVQNSQNTCC